MASRGSVSEGGPKEKHSQGVQEEEEEEEVEEEESKNKNFT